MALKIPTSVLDAFDVIPGYVYAAALGITVIGGGIAIGFEQLRIAARDTQIANGKTEIAGLKQAAEKDRADRLQLVAAHNLEIAQLQADHAKHQQEMVDAFQAEKKSLALRYERDLARERSVHDAAAAEAARDRAASPNDPVACQRLADRNATLVGLLDQGFSLVAESRKLLGDRDAEVKVLKETIENDRARICPTN